MKVETVQTTTFYLTLVPAELALLRENSWLYFPPMSHDLILRQHPSPDPNRVVHGQPNTLDSLPSLAQCLARIQLRADYLRGLDLHPAVDGTMEFHVRSERITAFNHNLVGPVAVLGEIPALDRRTLEPTL